jgi:hypothetical protein
MTQQTKPSIFDRIVEAVIKRLEGGDDPRRKYDYLMDPPNIKTSSILSDTQLDGVAESTFLGETFPSLEPLKAFSVELARWSPSKAGKAREQLTATMISQETHVIPTVLSQQAQAQSGKKDKKEKEAKEN